MISRLSSRIKVIGKGIFLVFVVLVGFLMLHIDAEAATGTVTYGSESYVWYIGQTVPIGVYIKSNEVIEEYVIELEYDTSKLRYLDGVSEQSGNRLYIRSFGKETNYKHMLHFEVLEEGATTIEVISAVAWTDKEMQQQMDMTLSTAPIQIYKTIDSRLNDISVNGVSIEGFSADKLEYEMEVEEEITAVNIQCKKIDPRATVVISDTNLQTGENVITVKTNGSSKSTTYVLYITRKEKEEIIISPGEATEIEESDIITDNDLPSDVTEDVTEETSGGIPTDNVTEEKVSLEDEEMYKNEQKRLLPIIGDVVLWGAVGTTVILVFVYWRMLINKRKKRKDEEVIENILSKDLRVINPSLITMVKVKNVTMQFRMAQDEASSLKEYLIRTIKKQNKYNYLTALDNISFEVMQGDVVGIIGTNGAGKSTLLKIISGALYPTKGKVKVDSRKVQMLTLGTGFDMELTARENVYLNGAIIGYTKEYIDEKFDDIVAFAELEGFMDERMKNFSSGMVSRLGFAIATMRDTPEILILDEVLSVGDMFFKQKSEDRIKEMIHGGATVFMVSHSVDTIKKNCNKVIWIEKGVLQMMGDPEEVCKAYQNYGA